MKRKRKRVRTAWALWADQLETGLATAATLAVRVPQLLSGTMTPAETQLMVAEKVAAVRDGVRHGSLAAARLAASNLAGRRTRPPTLRRTLADALTIAEASCAPARRTVRANAKRLTSGSGAKRSKP